MLGGDSLLVERNRLTLRERAADILRQAIIDQRFPPGTHLKERELCDMLGVSRTSVREALRHLESECLIETVPHKGPVVVTLTMQDARELYQVRAALEGLAGELFAAKASDQQIAPTCAAPPSAWRMRRGRARQGSHAGDRGRVLPGPVRRFGQPGLCSVPASP